MMEITASTMITGAAWAEAPGNSGSRMPIMAKVPTLSSTPTSRVEVPGVACAAASGNHVCTGTIGALIANAMKKVRKTELRGGLPGEHIGEVVQPHALRVTPGLGEHHDQPGEH